MSVSDRHHKYVKHIASFKKVCRGVAKMKDLLHVDASVDL